MVKDEIHNLPGELLRQILHSICERYDNDTVRALKEALFNFGIAEGKKLRARINAEGSQLNISNYLQHNHFINVFTHPDIDLGNGKHIHVVTGFTSFNDGHRHAFIFTTLIQNPIG